jgi:hypothetical protein
MRALLLSLIAGLFLLPAFAQKKIELHSVDHKLDSTKHYHKILIVAEGSMQARMYMDNLSAELIKELKSQNIECKYEYLGDHHKTNTGIALEKAKAWPHDAILQFFPLATFERVRSTEYNNGSTQAGTNNMSAAGDIGRSSGSVINNTVLQQYLVNDFDITLAENSETIWSAKLHTVIEFGKITVYKRIRKVILTDMEKQNVLPH